MATHASRDTTTGKVNEINIEKFLKENYDVRGVLMFGIRVDHHRVSQLLSVLGSAIVISVGYGVRSLLE